MPTPRWRACRKRHGHLIVRAIPAPSDRVNHNHAPRMGEYQHGSRVAAAVRSDLRDM
jgi:hypothetical protein